MRFTLRHAVAALSLASLPIVLPASIGVAVAQQQPPAGEEAPKQMALTDKQIDNMLAARPDVDAIMAKLPQGADQPNPKVVAQLDAVVKKHGFANYGDYDDVSGNVSLVMAGFDPQSKKYVGEEVVLKQEIAAMQADKKMPAKDKKEALDQMNAALKSITPLQFPANVALVAKYYDKLAEGMQQNQ
jgi:hypothetical protein